ncbi:MAG: hypothetical protein ACPGVA_10515, partial [Pikeienuella sp.]
RGIATLGVGFGDGGLAGLSSAAVRCVEKRDKFVRKAWIMVGYWERSDLWFWRHIWWAFFDHFFKKMRYFHFISDVCGCEWVFFLDLNQG